MASGTISNYVTGKIYHLTIPYNSSHSGDILWLLQNAVDEGLFIPNMTFVGTINPASQGLLIGYMYTAGTTRDWYGSIIVCVDGNVHSYKCSINTVTLVS